MAVHRRHLKVVSPCPVELDPERGKRGEASWYCGHCKKNVHVLSNMTEADARQLLARNLGNEMCVSYAVHRDGRVKFKPAAAAAAVALTAALAACAPHDNDRVERPTVTVHDGGAAPTPTPPTIPDRVEPEPEPEHEIAFDGEVALDEPEEIVEGGLQADPLPEPDPAPPRPGGMIAAPIPDHEPLGRIAPRKLPQK
jgi:hypothetical protein